MGFNIAPFVAIARIQASARQRRENEGQLNSAKPRQGGRNPMRTVMRNCVLCGQWGVRGFRVAEASELVGRVADSYVCANDRECIRRRADFPSEGDT